MTTIDYIGLDVHKKSISFCAKAQDGRILDEGKIAAQHKDLNAWAKARPRPWVGALEATLFTGWIYDDLKPLAQDLKVAHPAMLKAMAAGARGGGASMSGCVDLQMVKRSVKIAQVLKAGCRQDCLRH